AMNQISKQYPKDVSIQSEVHFKESIGGSALTSESQIADAIGKAITIQSPAIDISVDGNSICYVRTLEEAEQLTDIIKKPYMDEITSSDSQLLNIDFSENVQFDSVQVDFKNIISADEALVLLQQANEDIVEHIASDDDTLWDLAQENSMKVEEIQALNPDLDPGKIKEGDIIVLSGEKKLLNIVTEETLSYDSKIPYETEKKNDNTLLRGNTKTVQKGKDGKKQVELVIVRQNGKEVSREIIKETILEEPVKKILAVGTKKPEPKVTTSRSSSSKSSSKSTISVSGVTGQDIANYAQTHLGKKYVSGGVGPNVFDCSGFTVYVYKHFGISIPRMNQRSAGVAISKADARPGDIICLPGHVGIYAGNGQMIDAANSRKGVVKRKIYSSNYVVRRIIN
ncbi:MAG: LysM peptidoglycan-binding domain-containing protein, partial [Clostridiales bacterium]|nr:LysM peptidoglycan-binding domain-containing protein [Clostridiales bacterium]